MNTLENTLIAVMTAGFISLAVGKITNNDYLTNIGLGVYIFPVVYANIALNKPKVKDDIKEWLKDK